MGTGEQVVFSAQRNGTNRIFDRVVVYFQFAVLDVQRQFGPSFKAVCRCHGQGIFGCERQVVVFQEFPDFFQHRHGLRLSLRSALFVGQAFFPALPLDGIQFLYKGEHGRGLFPIRRQSLFKFPACVRPTPHQYDIGAVRCQVFINFVAVCLQVATKGCQVLLRVRRCPPLLVNKQWYLTYRIVIDPVLAQMGASFLFVLQNLNRRLITHQISALEGFFFNFSINNL